MSDACPVCGGKPIDEVKYISMCDKHKAEVLDADARRAGVADLQYSKSQLATPEGRQLMLNDIQFRLEAHPTKYINIKVTQ